MKKINSIWLLVLVMLTAANIAAQTTTTAQLQTISGNVYDEASKSPLPGVIVMQLNSSVTANGTASDSAGNFKLQVPLGRQSIRLTMVGYETRVVNDIVVTAGKEVHLNVSMQESLKQLNDVTVTYSKAKDKTRTNNDMAMVSARSFNVDETKRYAGALGDPSRMAANFAGVASGNDATNDIVVRGNSPSGMLWQLEGLNIPNPNHYGSLGSTGGPVSMINNNNIDKSDFITSAFPAQYGNAVAGVFDIRLRDGNKDKNEYMAQVGFNGFELGAEGPLGKKKNTSYLINYRYSTLGVFQQLGINFGTGSATPLYQDLNFKITSQISKSAKISFFGISGTSSIAFMGKDVDTTKTELYGGDPYANQRSRYITSVTGLSYEQRLSSKTFTRLTLGYAATYEKYHEDSITYNPGAEIPTYEHKFTTSKISAIYMLAHKLSARDNVEAGITYDHTIFNLYDRVIHPGGTDDLNVNSKGNYGLAQAYGQWKHRFTNNWSAVGGMHFQYISVSNSFAPEPRFSMRYALNSRQAISAGYGLHHQAQNIFDYYIETSTPTGVIYTNKDLGFTRSNHFVITYDWNITENLRLKAETYYQALNNVPVEQRPTSFSALNTGANFSNSATDSLVNKGTGYNYGAEITLERFYKQGYYFLFTTSLFQSKYKGSDGIERNTAFNTGYVFNALAGKEFKLGAHGNTLALNLKLTSVGGRYLTPIDLAQSRIEGGAVYEDNLAFSQRQSGYFRTDIKIAYKKEYKKSTLEIALDLQNVTNNQNVFSQYYDRRTGKIVTVYQQSFFPIPMVRYTF